MPKAVQTIGWWNRPTSFLEQCRQRYGNRFTSRDGDHRGHDGADRNLATGPGGADALDRLETVPAKHFLQEDQAPAAAAHIARNAARASG
jgi:hypothetical protein